MQQARRSKIVEEDAFYVKYSPQGVTAKAHSLDDINELACYRKVQRNHEATQEYKGQKLYEDEYQIDLGVQFGDDDRVIVKRLSTLYPITNRPQFFDLTSDPSVPEDPKKVPHCINELAIFPTVHYKSLFLTQNFSPSGKYVVITNIDGRFEAIAVDDRIPVYRDTLEPVWGASYRNPWQLILLKVWAKKLQGYNRVEAARPFEFLESFSNPTWKYFNLTKNSQEFIHKYSKFHQSSFAKIVLKSKEDSNVVSNGFIPNSASYQIVKGITQVKQQREVAYLAIRGTSKSHWHGTLGFLDKNIVAAFNRIQPQISLDRCFIMSSDELLNNFSAAYITSIRKDSYFTDYQILTIQENEKKAQHFEFDMPADGFFDFSVKQFPDNIIAGQPNKSRISTSSIGLAPGKRYLKNKYLLVRDNLASDVNKSNLNVEGAGQQPQSVINSNIYVSTIGEYSEPRFTLYEIQYLAGYNKGEAHFLSLKKGRYILRLKSELTHIQAKYSVNWVSSHRIHLREANLAKQEKVDLLHNSIVSFMHKTQHYCFEKGKRTEMISYGNTFQEIGYGYVAVKSTKSCPYSILLEVDPEVLRSQGYALKGKYKNEKKPFKIAVERGEYDSVVLKLLKNAPKYVWPTAAFKVWKKEDKQRRSESVARSSGLKNVGNPQQSNVKNPQPNEEDLYAAEAAQH